jgi:hypothetical protein
VAIERVQVQLAVQWQGRDLATGHRQLGPQRCAGQQGSTALGHGNLEQVLRADERNELA